jgi:hypothetical protein
LFDDGESDNSTDVKCSSESDPTRNVDVIRKEPSPLHLQSSSPSHEKESHHSSDLGNDESPQNLEKGKKLTKNQKKKRQRRKKKKAAAQERKAEESSRHVSFTDVAIRAFPRAFSADSVPGHGGWPLGMKLEGYEDCEKIPVEEYETSKQNQLRERWIAILSAREKKITGSPSKCSSPSKSSSPSKKKKEKPVVDEQTIRLIDGITTDKDNDTPTTNIAYETRQWDYRSRLKNPLFGMLSEDERHAIFLESSGIDPTFATDNHNPKKNSGRARSYSVGNHNHSGSSPRARSKSFGNQHDLENSIKGKFNEEYNQAMVHHARNELEQIRIERNKSGATGCNCRKIVVYLPPKDGSGGKKAQHRRLKPSKVVQELKKRHLYDSSVAAMSREQMEKLLHKVVENEPCCRDESCFCFRNGINCQADTCSCWHDSHVHAKRNSGSNVDALSNDDIRKRCGNPLGTYVVDMVAIDAYRADTLKQTKLQLLDESIQSDTLYCQFVDPS